MQKEDGGMCFNVSSVSCCKLTLLIGCLTGTAGKNENKSSFLA